MGEWAIWGDLFSAMRNGPEAIIRAALIGCWEQCGILAAINQSHCHMTDPIAAVLHGAAPLNSLSSSQYNLMVEKLRILEQQNLDPQAVAIFSASYSSCGSFFAIK